MHMKMLESTRKEQKRGMTNILQNRNLLWDSRFFYTILAYDYFPVSCIQDGQVHSWLGEFFHMAVKIINKENRSFKVNGQWMKLYIGADFNKHEASFDLNTI